MAPPKKKKKLRQTRFIPNHRNTDSLSYHNFCVTLQMQSCLNKFFFFFFFFWVSILILCWISSTCVSSNYQRPTTWLVLKPCPCHECSFKHDKIISHLIILCRYLSYLDFLRVMNHVTSLQRHSDVMMMSHDVITAPYDAIMVPYDVIQCHAVFCAADTSLQLCMDLL